jgi:hypothetical protein
MGSLLGFSCRNVRAFAIIAKIEALLVSTPIELIETFRGAETAIGSPGLQETFDMFMVRRKTFRLTIRSVRTVDYRAYLDLAIILFQSRATDLHPIVDQPIVNLGTASLQRPVQSSFDLYPRVEGETDPWSCGLVSS